MIFEIAFGIILAFVIIAMLPNIVRVALFLLPVALFLLPVGLVAYVVWYIA